MGKKKITLWLSVTISILIVFVGLFSNASADETDTSIFGTAPVKSDFKDYIDDPRAEPLFDNNGNYFGFIPLPFGPEKHVDTGLLQVSLTDAKYDLRDPDNNGDNSDSIMSQIDDQGACGSCWAFASLGVLESALLKNGMSYDFSENHLIKNHGFDAGACEGGNILFASAYMSAYRGVLPEDQDPYQINGSSCTTCPPTRYIDNTILLPVRSGVNDYQYIKGLLVENGALYTSIYYDNANYHPKSATYYYNDFNNSFADANHAVVIVGWDDLKVVDGIEQPGAFIVRNSWGTKWGDNGYFYVSYYDESIGFSILARFDEKEDSLLPFNKIYQHDEIGWTGSSVNRDTAWGGNWFIPDNNGTLNAVSFAATSSNIEYEIVIYDDFDGFSNSFSNVLTRQTGKLQYQGWYTIPLSTPVNLKAGDGYAVTVKFFSPGKSYLVPTEGNIQGFSSNAVNSKGESFVSVDGVKWFDSHDFEYNVAIKGLVSEGGVQECEAAPASVNATMSMDENTVNISWSSSPPCTGTQYDFYYADFPTLQNINLIPMGTQTVFSKEFTPGASFYFAILARNSKGSVLSQIDYFEIPCPNTMLCSMNKSFPGNLDVFESKQETADKNWNLISMSAQETDGVINDFYTQNSDQIDDMLELNITVSTNAADLELLKKSMWSFEILTDTIYIGDLYFASETSKLSNGIPVLLTLDGNGNEGLTFYGQLPYGGSGFITSIKEGSCYAYYFMQVTNSSASGRYQKECSSPGQYYSLAANVIKTPVSVSRLYIKNTDYVKFDYLFPKKNYAVDIFVVLYTPDGNYQFLDSNGDFINDFGHAYKISTLKTIRDTGFFKKSSFQRGNYSVFWLIAPTTNGNLNSALNVGNYIVDGMSFNISN